jgi:methylated-DNA-[protein]-cysteine S-methyltransferase
MRDMNERLLLLIDRLDTPIGEMLIVTDLEGHLRAVDWADHEMRMNRLLRVHYGSNGFSLDSTRIPNGVTDAISRYFQGDLAAIDTLPVKQAERFFRVMYGGPCEISHAGQRSLT